MRHGCAEVWSVATLRASRRPRALSTCHVLAPTPSRAITSARQGSPSTMRTISRDSAARDAFGSPAVIATYRRQSADNRTRRGTGGTRECSVTAGASCLLDDVERTLCKQEVAGSIPAGSSHESAATRPLLRSRTERVVRLGSRCNRLSPVGPRCVRRSPRFKRLSEFVLQSQQASAPLGGDSGADLGELGAPGGERALSTRELAEQLAGVPDGPAAPAQRRDTAAGDPVAIVAVG